MGNLSTMLLFLLPAAIALLGLIKTPRIPWLLLAAGIMWLSFGILFMVWQTGVGDFRFTLAWISWALGIAFVLFILTAGNEEDLPAKDRLEEKRAQKEIDTIELAEEKGETYEERMASWRKDRGLKSKRERRGVE